VEENHFGRGVCYGGRGRVHRRERDQFEDLRVDGKIILKWALRIFGSEDVAWIDLAKYTDKWRALVQVIINILVP
jgi:hypothetical protein